MTNQITLDVAKIAMTAVETVLRKTSPGAEDYPQLVAQYHRCRQCLPAGCCRYRKHHETAYRYGCIKQNLLPYKSRAVFHSDKTVRLLTLYRNKIRKTILTYSTYRGIFLVNPTVLVDWFETLYKMWSCSF